MGYMKHDVVVATMSDSVAPDMDAFRASIPERFRSIVIGPIPGVINGYVTCAMLPDGSKEGWADSDEADAIRARFVALFGQRYEDGSSDFDVVHAEFGGDFTYESGINAADPRTGEWRREAGQ